MKKPFLALAAVASLSAPACSSKTPAPSPTDAATTAAGATVDAGAATSAPSADAGAAENATAADDAAGAPENATADAGTAAPTGPIAVTGDEPARVDPSERVATPIDAWALPSVPTALELFPDGKSALVAFEGGLARVDLATGAVLWVRYDPDLGDVRAIAPSGRYVWYASIASDAVRLDAATGVADWRVHGPTTAMALVAVDDTTIVYDDGGGASVLEVGERVRSRKIGDEDRAAVGPMTCTPDHKTVVAFDGTTLRWIDPRKATITKTRPLPEDASYGGDALLFPDGSALAALVDGKVAVFALPGLAKRAEIAVPDGVDAARVATVSADGKLALVASGTGLVYRVDLDAKSFDPKGVAGDFGVVTADRTYALTDKRGVVGYDASGAVVASAAGAPLAVLVSGGDLVVARTTSVATLSTAAPWIYRPPTGSVLTKAFMAAGGALALELEGADGKASQVALDPKTGLALPTTPSPLVGAAPLAAKLADPTTLVVQPLGSDGKLGPETKLTVPDATPTWLAVTAGKARVAAISGEEVVVWDRGADGGWSPPRRFGLVASRATAIALSPDDAIVAIDTTDSILALELATGRILATITAAAPRIAWAFSADGKSLVTDSGRLERWSLDPKDRAARPAWIAPWFVPSTFEGTLAGEQTQVDPDSGKESKTKLASKGTCEITADHELDCKGFTAGDYEPRVPVGSIREDATTFMIGDLALPRDLHVERYVELYEYDGDMVVSKSRTLTVDDQSICLATTEGVAHEGGDTLCLARAGGYSTWHQAEGSAAVTSDFTITFKPPTPK